MGSLMGCIHYERMAQFFYIKRDEKRQDGRKFLDVLLSKKDFAILSMGSYSILFLNLRLLVTRSVVPIMARATSWCHSVSIPIPLRKIPRMITRK